MIFSASESDINKQTISDCIRRLECLKNEHNITIRKYKFGVLKNKNEDDKNNPKIKMVQESLETVEKAIFDAKSLLKFYSCLEGCEIQHKKMELELKVLQSENNWQKNEIKKLVSLLNEKDKSIMELESQLEHFSFIEKFQSFNVSTIQDSSITMTENSGIEISKCGSQELHPKEKIVDNCHAFNPDISFESEIPSKLKTLHGLVLQYVSQGKYELALPLCKQVIEDLESSRGHYDADVAVMLYIMALVYRDLQNYQEAIKYLNDSLHIRETIFGRYDLTVASTLNNLSVLYGRIKQLDLAEIMCKNALEIRESVLGDMHADVAKQLTNLALIYQNKQNFTEAEKCFIRAQNIYEVQLGKNDPYSIKTRCNLGCVYVKQEKYREALNIYEEVLVQIYEQLNENGDNASAEKNAAKNQYNLPYDQLGQWHKASRVDRPTINSIFKYLLITYSKLNESEKLIISKSIKQETRSSEKLKKIQHLIKLIKKDN